MIDLESGFEVQEVRILAADVNDVYREALPFIHTSVFDSALRVHVALSKPIGYGEIREAIGNHLSTLSVLNGLQATVERHLASLDADIEQQDAALARKLREEKTTDGKRKTDAAVTEELDSSPEVAARKQVVRTLKAYAKYLDKLGWEASARSQFLELLGKKS